MSSINLFPTFNYSQPESYHFSHDSIFLAREIFERYQQTLSTDVKILDLCAGCGIVGLDLLFHQLNENKKFNGEMDFLEVQEIYQSHFITNLKTLQNYFPENSLKVNWIQNNYAEIKNNKKYDLIISNPPYFLTGRGVLSPDEFKNRCRFFMDAEWQAMIEFIELSLKPQGQAYFLVRDDLKKIIETEMPQKIYFPFKIRGTWVAQLFSHNK